MGRYLRKCKKVVGEIAVVGVKTRARAALAMAAASSQQHHHHHHHHHQHQHQHQQQQQQQGKKIKKVSKSSSSTSYDVHHPLRSRRRSNLSSRKKIVDSSSEVVEDDDDEVANCSTSEVSTANTTNTADASGSDFPPPCCSSNNDQSSSSEVVKDRLGKSIADPEVESPDESLRDFDCERATQSEATKSEDQESPATKLPEPKSTVQIKMPSDAEIEEFFAAAEKDLHKRFIDKYNFDIVKDVPLEGRYDWVQIKP